MWINAVSTCDCFDRKEEDELFYIAAASVSLCVQKNSPVL